MSGLLTRTAIQNHDVVSSQEWTAARKELLRKEKEFTRLRDELSRQRRELPWEKVEKQYVFDGPNGKQTLADLFDGRSQLIVYHFMFGPGWEAGCPSCSFLADHFDGTLIHLAHRDVTLAVISRAPLAQIESLQETHGLALPLGVVVCQPTSIATITCRSPRMNWPRARWTTTTESWSSPVEEAPGLSVFYKDEAGEIFHTYSTYARGLDMLIGTYNFLDIAPKGRDEEGLTSRDGLGPSP